MTPIGEALDRLAPVLPWAPDWPDVLERAGESARARRRPARRLLLALALLVAVFAPLAAVASSNGWWFLGSGPPEPLSAPVLVQEGVWSGRAWQLVAYRSRTGLCFAVTPKATSTSGLGAASACAPVAGAPRAADARPAPDLTITYLSSGATEQLPGYVAGPVVDAATEVEIRLGAGVVLRVPTVAAPTSLGDVRFYAAQLPAGISSRDVGRLVGLGRDGSIVACLVPSTASAAGSPLSDCR